MKNQSTSKSTFLITSSKHRSFGTGFCIYKDEKGSYLLTAGHVVESCGLEYLLVDVYDELSQKNVSYKAEIFSLSEDTDIVDLALIYVEGLTDTIALKISNEIREFNAKEDTFEISGFRPHKGLYANEPLKGYIKKAYPLQSKSGTTWVYDLIINTEDTIVQGYSGSAIVCSLSGLVLGVATDRKKGGKQAYAIPAYYLKYIWEDMPTQEIVEPLEKNNPYKGLSSFEYKDKHNYYGREKESSEIAKVLKGTKLFTLLGASGSGKSSLVFAGIKPLIEEKDVKIVDFRPQDRPFKNLASIFTPLLYSDRLKQIEQNNKLSQKLLKNEIRLDDLVANLLNQTDIKHLYIVIDQFEEIFTLAKDSEERNAFLEQLLTLIDSQHPITLLISMRSDFLSHVSFYEAFNQAFNEHKSTSLSLLSSENLQKVIEEPSKKLGVRFQEGLVDRIIDEIKTEAGQLPLLEFALEQFWNKRKGRFITHEILDEMKSISHSISHYADNIYYKHDKYHNAIKKVLIKLVNPGSGTEDTRRIASFKDFNKDELKIVQLLASERLVVTRDESVDIVHEALLREWKRLKGWINEYREFLEWQKKLRDDRANYVSNAGKDDEKNLLTESKLLRSKEFLESHEEFISLQDREFILKSIEVAKRKKRNKNIAIVSGFVFLVGVIVVIWFFFQEADRAKEEAVVAKVETQSKLYDNIVQQGITVRDYLKDTLKSKLIFAEGLSFSTNKNQVKKMKLLYASDSSTKVYLNNFMKDSSLITGVLFSKDEEKVLSWSSDGKVKLWNVNIAIPLQVFEHDDVVNGAIFSKDEKQILSWGKDMSVRLWSLNSATPLKIFQHDDDVIGARFSKNNQQVFSWSKFEKIKLWNVNSTVPLQVFKHDDTIIGGATFSKDEKQILSWDIDGDMKLWSVKSTVPLQIFKHNRQVYGVKFSRDEKQILSWGRGGKVKLWSVDKKNPLQVFKHAKAESDAVIGVRFSKNGKKILSWGQDETVKLWSINKSIPLQIFRHNNFVEGAIFSKDEKKIFSWTTGKDSTIKLWNVDSETPILVLIHDSIKGVVLSKDERQIISWSEDGTVKLWSVDSTIPLQILKHDSMIVGANFSKNNKQIFSWSKDGVVKIWNISNETSIQFLKHKEDVKGAKFSRDEKKILSWSRDSTIKLWSINSTVPLRVFKDDSIIEGAIFSKDEKQILSWNFDGEVKLWSVNSTVPLQTFKHNQRVYGAKFSRDTKKILSWSRDKKIKLWNIKSTVPLQVFNHDSMIKGAIFSKDEKQILSWGFDDKVKLWSINHTLPLKVFQHDSFIEGAIFNTSNKKILSWNRGGEVKLWSVNSTTPLQVFKHDDFVDGAIFSKNNQEILSWSSDGIIKLWNINSTTPLQVFKHNQLINGVTFSKNNQQVLSWSDDSRVKLWNVESTTPIEIFNHGNEYVLDAKFSEDEKQILSLTEDGTVKIWSVDKSILLKTFKKNSDKEYEYVQKVKFSKYGKKIFIFTKDNVRTYGLYKDINLKKEYYSLKTQVETGAYLTPSGEVKALTKKEWLSKKEKYEKILAEVKD